MKLTNILREISLSYVFDPKNLYNLFDILIDSGEIFHSPEFTQFYNYLHKKYIPKNPALEHDDLALFKALEKKDLIKLYKILTSLKENLREINFKKAAAIGALAGASMFPIDTGNKTQKPHGNLTKQEKEVPFKIEFDKFIKAIHQVEAGGQLGPILGDNGRALGPFQIHKVYWNDVKDQVGGRYKDVIDYDYSKKVMIAYFLKHAKEAFKNRDWEKLARIHNGGPNGYKKKSTERYWKKVKSHL